MRARKRPDTPMARLTARLTAMLPSEVAAIDRAIQEAQAEGTLDRWRYTNAFLQERCGSWHGAGLYLGVTAGGC